MLRPASGLLALLLAACGAPAAVRPDASEEAYRAARLRMVDEQIRARGISDARVLEAMRKVPRHRFVPERLRALAYEDSPLPIGAGQTISQPYIVAYMTEALAVEPGHKVLEIGTGSGYQAAVLAEIAREVYTIEIVPELAERAARVLRELGYTNVHVRTGDGYLGWPEQAPFPRIMVTAAPPEVPSTLVDQLDRGGRLVVPVGTAFQMMTIVTKTEKGVERRETIPVRFVPMVRRPGV
ncbi:MAG TPA: protein-L-isoaspartate(D-aspartate) O-methyltransferase [Vicinamibacterales bacterium]|nr:protein-L-isoaspartate(D-aspartate) O-methyltransferase [Vicinamibacterales bacterium]